MMAVVGSSAMNVAMMSFSQDKTLKYSLDEDL